MSIEELHYYRVTCDHDFGACTAYINVAAKSKDHLGEVLVKNKWSQPNMFREHCPKHAGEP